MTGIGLAALWGSLIIAIASIAGIARSFLAGIIRKRLLRRGILALVTELQRLGLRADEHDDGLTIYPGPMQPAVIETYDDHRMAMSFAVLGLGHPGVRIADPGCTSKTYPHFFDDLDRLCRGAA